MEHWLAFFQTLLWVALIGGIVWRFNSPIHGLLVALQKRVESGSGVKAGPFELSEVLSPSTPEEQKARLAEEIREDIAPVAVADPQPPNAKRSSSSLAIEAEDLALRAIQFEYNSPISRHLRYGPGYVFDGAFTTNGRLNIVETKYVRQPSSIPNIRHSLEKISQLAKSNNWRNVQAVLAVVFENDNDLATSSQALSEVTKDLGIECVVRSFSIHDLRNRFEVEAP